MKKSLLIIAIFLVLAGMLVNTGCKSNKLDLSGVWFIETILEGNTFSESYTFAGDDRGGDVLFQGQVLGTYSASGDSISFTLEYFDQDDDYTVEVYQGSMDTDDQMSGNFTYSVEGFATLSGTFVGIR